MVDPDSLSDSKNNHGKKYSNDKGNVKRQLYVSAVANLLQMMQGCVLPISSFILPQIQESKEDFSISKEQGSWFASLYCIGYLSGAVIGGIQSEVLGRRISLIVDSFVAIIGLAVLAISQSFPLFLIGRYLCGHASGSGTVAIPIYTSEISHSSVRGVTGSFLILFYFCGCSITTVLGTILPWRLAIAAVGICPATAIILLFFSHSSPTWLLRHGKDKEAMKSLLYFIGSESAAKKERDLILSNIVRENKENETKGNFQDELKKKLKRLRCPSFWKPFLIILFILPVSCELSLFPMMVFYMVNILQKIRVPMDPYKAASVVMVTRFFTASFSLLYISKIKRRTLFFPCLMVMIFGAGLLSVNDYLFTKGYYNDWEIEDFFLIKWAPIIGIFGLYVANSFGLSQMVYMIQGELFPADTRSIGGGIIGILDGLCQFIAIKIGLNVLENVGAFAQFGITFIMLCFLGIFTYIFLPETYGKHLCEIESYFLGECDREKRNKENNIKC